MGIGTKLMAYLINEAINLHVVNITLEVRVSNEIARNLYKKFGFHEVALRKFYYGDEDGILMGQKIIYSCSIPISKLFDRPGGRFEQNSQTETAWLK